MKRQFRASLLMCVVVLGAVEVARGQTLLRWKLKPGESLGLTVQQETESEVAFSGKRATTKIDMTVELKWLVVAADDKGIKIKQTIDGIKLKLQSPQGGVVEFDSAERPTAPVREIADSLKPLIGKEIELTMTARGEVVAVDPASTVVEEAPPSPGTGTETAGVSRTSVERLLRQTLIVLPEQPVAEGDDWKHTANLSIPAGNFEQVKTFRLAGMKELEGQQIALVEMKAKLDPVAAAAAPKLPAGKKSATGKLAVKTHEQSGTIQFAVGAGRVVEAEQTQKLVTERVYREATIVVTLSSKQTTAVRTAQ